ncbi:hypothetical protein [Micromonospora zhanjiangensis]|uniref:Uncharacterized protein n=1 Tax=Micromonospora zhanjiangensis TaxID=1522057 RepID=A0ABV8KMF6_9ACTN
MIPARPVAPVIRSIREDLVARPETVPDRTCGTPPRRWPRPATSPPIRVLLEPRTAPRISSA